MRGDSKELALQVTEIARDKGATGAEVLIREGMEFKTSVRMGAVETLLQADYRRLGMRVYTDHRAAVFATSDFRLDSVANMIAETLVAAKLMHEEPATDIPREDGEPPQEFTSPELCFPAVSGLSADFKIEQARQCEEAALKLDPRVTNSEGAEFSDSLVHTTYANSLGVCAAYAKSVYSLSVTPLAEENRQKQRDYWLSTHVDHSRLQLPAEIGAEAARRALRRLGARKVRTCEVPVVFDPLAASTLLRHVSEAVSGTTLLRQASFLMGRLGRRVASPLITLLDDACCPADWVPDLLIPKASIPEPRAWFATEFSRVIFSIAIQPASSDSKRRPIPIASCMAALPWGRRISISKRGMHNRPT
jgi:PmbA protein